MAYQTTSTSKTVTMTLLNDSGYYANTYHGTITSNMKEGEDIFAALRNFSSNKIAPAISIIIWHPLRKEKVRLHFDHLHEGHLYRVAPTVYGRQQGPGVEASGAYSKTQRHLEAICGHWGLSDVGDILPDEIAPRDGNALVAPGAWTAAFADELRKLSGRSVGRRHVVMQHLSAAVQARREAGGHPVEVTSGDCKLAVKSLVLAGMADAA
jgi:hypothetical protein